MNAYIYQAALWCEDCALAIRKDLGDGKPGDDDSDQYPQGPYDDGGGEADSPQHCDGCSTFLENPLTGDGQHYVARAIVKDLWLSHFNSVALTVWSDFYELDTVTNLIEALKAS